MVMEVVIKMMMMIDDGDGDDKMTSFSPRAVVQHL